MKEIDMNVPTSWDEITLEMFDGITLADGNPYEKTVSILNVLTGLSEDEIRKMPAVTLEAAGINKKLAFLAKEPRKRMPQEKYSTKNFKYNVSVNPNKWTAAQYLDYCTVLSGGETKKIARLIACFTVPEGCKYGDGYDFERVVDDLYENMPITVALGYSGFFQLQLTSYEKALSAYMEKKSRKSTRRRESRS